MTKQVLISFTFMTANFFIPDSKQFSASSNLVQKLTTFPEEPKVNTG